MTADEDRLRDLTREANAAIKDLRAALREAREYERSQLAREHIDELINEAVKAGLKGYEKALDDAIKNGTDAVFARFDKIADILMGEDAQSVREGKAGIPDMVTRLSPEKKAQARRRLNAFRNGDEVTG